MSSTISLKRKRASSVTRQTPGSGSGGGGAGGGGGSGGGGGGGGIGGSLGALLGLGGEGSGAPVVESWTLKDVVFLEDVKSVPVGKVIKVHFRNV